MSSDLINKIYDKDGNIVDWKALEQLAAEIKQKDIRFRQLTEALTNIIIDYLLENDLDLSAATNAIKDIEDRIFDRLKAKSG